MKKLLFAFLVALLAACNASDSYQQRTHQRLAERKALLPEFSFDFIDTIANVDEREAMAFLYAYMPLSDIADYEPSFFKQSAQIALQARREMPWGKMVTDELFRHFVLPDRVNNEALDTFRLVYYDELAKRVSGLSMAEAALEVNHWCHEHVTYSPSDGRTSSPLAAIRTALGRCGEESVLAVAAMRTVGIPARQVYTPRWAHTDDNHAWIEVWTGDRWHFMGACEPEPVLDLGWFNASAGRAMLMHTQVFGPFDSAIDVISRSRCYTEINVIDGYVPTRRVTVSVVDSLEQPVADAKIEFKIFNYSEFCTVATLATDGNGQASLTTGLGNLLAWASNDGKFGYALVDSTDVTLRLEHSDGDVFVEDFDVVPPADNPIPSTATDEQIEDNKVRLAYEDSIRMAYVATFLSSDAARQRDHSDAEIALLARAAGNAAMLSDYILSINDADVRRSLVAALRHCSRKDLRDISRDVLDDFCRTVGNASELMAMSSDFVAQYLLCPRVELEPLRPFREAVAQSADLPSADSVRLRPSLLVEWVAGHVRVLDEENPRRMRISPAGVLRLRVADRLSRNIFFVALARALGLPARIESVTGQTEYFSNNQWLPVRLDEIAASAEAVPMGGLALVYEPQPGIENPIYYRHFSLARIENGVGSLLNFEEGDATELGATASATGTFAQKGYPLAEGYYMLTTGRRMADGRVLAHVETFNIKKEETARVPLVLRQPGEHDIQVMGSYDAEKRYLPIGAAEPVSMLATTGRGYYMMALLRPTDEPGMHATRALQSIAGRMQEWNRPLLVLFQSEDDYRKFDQRRLEALPNVSYGIDIDGSVAEMMRSAAHRPSASLPIVAIGDSFGRLIYMSDGYNTSLADQVVHTLTWM